MAAAFLEANTIYVLSTLMQDGSPYASVAHFAVDGQAQALYMSLDSRSQTAKNLLIDSRAAITIGHDPGVPATLQMRGHATIMQSAQLSTDIGTQNVTGLIRLQSLTDEAKATIAYLDKALSS